MGLHPLSPGGRKQDIEQHLRSCQWFHFAGHDRTDPVNAEESGLLPLAADDSKYKTNVKDYGVLRVGELLAMDLAYRDGLAPPFLAYLSACGTGRTRDEQAIDESTYLASAFHLAGFRHVVGTLWEVVDNVCVDVSRLTYEGTQRDWKVNGTWTDDSVARGRHEALRQLRDRDVEEMGESRGERDMELCSDDDDDTDDDEKSGKKKSKLALALGPVHTLRCLILGWEAVASQWRCFFFTVVFLPLRLSNSMELHFFMVAILGTGLEFVFGIYSNQERCRICRDLN
ncbi:hypothetical protein VTJ49DRAFT_2461 [Mycothermus thermophilus]|uniref:CHAT domain-containing protein n=1 Tax=Humicola insolens TaxID=85995 RepID=A0ABR3VA75_HUMIN